MFNFFKEVNSLILKAGSSAEQARSQEDINKATRTVDCTKPCPLETQAQETLMTSTCVQTIPTEYFGKNKSTQTKAELQKYTLATKGTQTFVTCDSLKNAFMPKAKGVSTSTQTDSKDLVQEHGNISESGETEYDDGVGKDNDQIDQQEIHSDVDDADIDTDIHADLDSDDNKDESCGEAFSQTGEESDFEYLDDNEICDKTITLNNKKSIKDQLKFIICEESLVTTFGVCLICGGHCKVSVGNVVGSYCKIYVSCTSSSEHNFSWSTGPLLNRLPALNLLMASSILSTGMECNKLMRFLESLHILHIKRREISSVQSAYVIPAVFNVWKTEQHKLLADSKGKYIDIASDMRVDSPGHSGLLGAGSTLDVTRNVILDTQIVKVSL